jgi:hypothetical protein
MFWECLALAYVACALMALFLNWKMHQRFKASDELKQQNEDLLRMVRTLDRALAAERAKKT